MFSKQGIIKCSMLAFMTFAVIFNSNFNAANSGPIRMTSWPATEIIIEENVPIGVTYETLHFDFSDALNHYAPIAKVNANYTMKHMGSESETYQMMFPLVTNILSLYQTISVRSNQEDIDFSLFVGNSNLIYLMEDAMPFDKLLENLRPLHSPINDLPDVWLYELTTLDEEHDYTVTYDVTENTHVLPPTSVRSYGGNQEGIFLNFRALNPDEQLSFFVIGNPLDNLTITNTLTDTNANYVMREYTWPSMINELIKSLDFILETIPLENLDFYAHIENALLNHMEIYPNEVIEMGYLTSYFYEPQLFSLFFSIDFDDFEEIDIQVQYHLEGTMDRSKSYEPVYSYQYFLSPAKHWAYFDVLEIIVTPPERAPFIIDSSIPLSKIGAIYTETFMGIPTDILSFTLHEKPNISSFEAFIAPKTRNIGYLMFFLVPILLGTFIVVIIGMIFNKLLKRGNHTL